MVAMPKVPYHPKKIYRDGVHGMLGDGEKPVAYHYNGTKPWCSRAKFRRNHQAAHLKRLGVRFSRAGCPVPTDKPTAASIYPLVKEYVTPLGDLIKREPPGHGCFGVPWWRAMAVKCATCPARSACDGVVAYRLTFGGREDFDTALSQTKDAERLYRSQKKSGRTLDFEREIEDPAIRRLRAAYLAIWYFSDNALHLRLKQPAVDAALAKKAAERKAQQEADARAKEAEQAEREAFDEECYAQLEEAMKSGRLVTIRSELDNFLSVNRSDRRWRKAGTVIPSLALVEISNQAVTAAANSRPGWRRRWSKRQVHEIAEHANMLAQDALSETAPGFPEVEVSYNAACRRLNTLERIRNAGGTLSTSS